MKTWKKTVLRFCIGGLLYFLIEIIWREVLDRSRGAHPLMILPAGTVLALIYFLDDRRWNIFLSALMGTLTVVSFEAVIGWTVYTNYGIYLWYYPVWDPDRFPLWNVISFRWSLVWYALCFACVLLKQIYEKRYFWKKWKNKQ